jgi:hypothetical protein
MSDAPDSTWLKADLLAYAEESGVAVDSSMTKAQILEALNLTDTPVVDEVETEPEAEAVTVWVASVDKRLVPKNPAEYGNLVNTTYEKRFVFYTYEGDEPTLPATCKARVTPQ